MIVPNHLHVLVAVLPGWELSKLVASWKKHSALRINTRLRRAGALWQKDYFDRIVRDSGHLGNCIRYIRRNPVKAGLSVGEYFLYECEWAGAVV